MNIDDAGCITVIVAALLIIIGFSVFLGAEMDCEKKYNVFDCELKQEIFQPVKGPNND